MNNKYDVNNFSKIIEEYKTEDEIEAIEKHLFGGSEVLATNGSNSTNTTMTEDAINDKPNDYSNIKIPKFDFVIYESKKYDLAKISQEQLSPPKDRLSHYTNTGDILKFILNKIFTEITVHEEYIISLTKIF